MAFSASALGLFDTQLSGRSRYGLLYDDMMNGRLLSATCRKILTTRRTLIGCFRDSMAALWTRRHLRGQGGTEELPDGESASRGEANLRMSSFVRLGARKYFRQ